MKNKEKKKKKKKESKKPFVWKPPEDDQGRDHLRDKDDESIALDRNGHEQIPVIQENVHGNVKKTGKNLTVASD